METCNRLSNSKGLGLSENRVCFLANFHKTAFFHAWAQAAEIPSSRVCWITTNRPLYGWLRDRYPEGQILLLNWARLAPHGGLQGDFRLRELVFGDRCLRHRMEDGLRWLEAIQEPLTDFIARLNIRHIVGEVTWAHEILIHRMTQAIPELGCVFLNPHTVRIPNGRFAFFLDEHQTELLPSGAPLPNDDELQLAFLVKKPEYLALNDKRVQESRRILARLAKLKRFLTRENIDSQDPTLLSSRWTQFRLRTGEEWSRESYRFLRREPMESLSGFPFVFLGLHKQPESSIDVLGRYYEDQLRNIENLWRVLPSGWRLVVKEHTNAIGDRPRAFYRALGRLPGVVLIDERTDSHTLATHAALVATVTGTVAYEAALLGRQSITLAPTFFNRLEGCRHIRMEDIQRSGILAQDPRPAMDPNIFGCWLWQHSFPGIISDPLSNPDCMTVENMQRLAQALLYVCA